MAENTNKSENPLPSWLNKKFLESALRSQEKDISLMVVSSEVNVATARGDNYLSDMYRAKLRVKRGKSNSHEEVSLIVKCTPIQPSTRNLVSNLGVFERERQMYNVILPEMFRILNDVSPEKYQPFSAKCLHSHVSPTQSALLLEDLKSQRFTMAERRSGFDMNHCLSVMRILARFHAASVAVYQQNPNSFKIFKNRVGSESKEMRKSWMDEYFKAVLKSLSEEIEMWPDIDQQYVDKLGNLARNIEGRLFDVTKTGDKFNVLTHGDMWVNNVMFRYEESTDRIQDVRFVDFQLVHWTSPAIDLLYFLYTSPMEKLLDRHDALIEAYHHELGQTLADLGLEHLHPTLTELQLHLEERSFYSVFVALAVLPHVTCNPNEALDMNKVFKQDVKEGIANSKFHSNEAYMKIMKKLLPIFASKGFI